MFELTLVFCLIASPTKCQEDRTMEQYETQMSCVVGAQMIASRWLEDHPKWKLDHWSCGDAANRQEKS